MLAVAATGCGSGGHRIAGVNHAQALAKAHNLADQLLAADRRACHRRKALELLTLTCRPGDGHWECPFTLSEGGAGLFTVPDRGHAEFTIIC
jgi:hypothetical protein